MENLYNDFTTKLLPQIQAGLTITKDYFLDLFGRYIHYLLITDTLYVILFTSFLTISVFFIIKTWSYARKNDSENGYIASAFLFFACIGFFLGIINYTNNLIKDKYIPEVRILETIKGCNTK